MVSTQFSVPGRICLFGEHLDYLGLPVIAAAISKRVTVTGRGVFDREATIAMPDISETEEFALEFPVPYEQSRDYLKAVANVLNRKGYQFSHGVSARVQGNIPINSGTSSSTALIGAWMAFLCSQSDSGEVPPPETLAEWAYEAEVAEFGEAGGKMDHYSTLLGNVIYLEPQPALVDRLSPNLGTFVLGDSGEPKDTVNILKRVKYGVLDLLNRIRATQPEFDLKSVLPTELSAISSMFDPEEYLLLQGTLKNRDILKQALKILKAPSLDHTRFGALLTEHHQVLREAQKISTPKIDSMLSAALDAGALGGKINGSGGGGCMFAYAPENAKQVAEAIENAGGNAYLIEVEEGLREEVLVKGY